MLTRPSPPSPRLGKAFHHLGRSPALLVGLIVTVLAAIAALPFVRPVTACLLGWDAGALAYGVVFVALSARADAAKLRRLSAELDEGRWGVLAVTVAAVLASLCAIVVELAQVHGQPQAGRSMVLAGITVVLSWLFTHAVFATHYAHEFWRDGTGLSFPGNDEPEYSEFLYFSFCIGVASQVSDVSTRTAGMRKLVLAHSMLAYLFNTAIIALGVNIAASLAG